jgi:hypothetical protein
MNRATPLLPLFLHGNLYGELYLYFYLVKKFRDNSPTVTSYVIIITTEPITHALIQQS